jgi:hypothetical protein
LVSLLFDSSEGKSHGQGTHERDREEGKQGSGIGERKWGGDFGRRMMMFESRVEIWE